MEKPKTVMFYDPSRDPSGRLNELAKKLTLVAEALFKSAIDQEGMSPNASLGAYQVLTEITEELDEMGKGIALHYDATPKCTTAGQGEPGREGVIR